MAAQAAPTADLLPLREEIAVFPGPTALDGSPTWTLHDPSCNRFYRLGWLEFELLSRWDSGTIPALMARVEAETTLRIEQEDVDDLVRFLFGFDLLRATSPQATIGLLGKAQRQRGSWGQWLLHNYLFVRIPLLRPDRFLTATYPYLRWLFTPLLALVVMALGIIGIISASRQWDVFLGTFVDLFSVQGAVGFGLTLACLKIVHELAHAYTAKRFGCRIPTMGLALLVMVPVLYTDVNEAWKLAKRKQRLAIGLAGVMAELACAAVALCAWGLLPNGPARSVAFLVATSTWLTTILLNASPFMRYDGYYVLSDWLEIPNLHARAFALAQWSMRETLLGLGDPVPEEMPLRRRRLLVVFAFLTWAYRFALFMGIAVIVYHFAIKILGVAMMIVEIGYFVLWPVVREARVWWSRRGDIRPGPRIFATGIAALLALALLLAPWRSAIEAPALMKSQQHVDIFAPEFGARIGTIAVKHGDTVTKGMLLAQLTSPDIDYRLGRARTEIDVLGWQLGARGATPEMLARSQVTEREYEAARAEYAALIDQKSRLQVPAPASGRIVDVAEALEPDTWIAAKSRLMSIVDPTGVSVDAYVDEADLDRIAIGDSATFFAEADTRLEYRLRIVEIARASTRMLPDPYLASTMGGPIPVRAQKQNELVPDRTIYRVKLAIVGQEPPVTRVLRGDVILRGEALSIAARIWRSFLAIAIRESGA
ncbi:HlyD family efflux transporter periplasmic adaptor subunit [Bosea sp. 685]|uniref:HlyD family efflux transporter periplasmic adaptor subunit n=1 Tax=Bosea sp. 685 TaxID=3080057 RepID=UPI002892E320|nr:HlyD family efflux transporter periplasmic adaptor subunit [Bosea sp. 685]WNJ91576.1 HlyD family efflux transporter periplasmic adaptor subunit [Bosea sp. 685]